MPQPLNPHRTQLYQIKPNQASTMHISPASLAFAPHPQPQCSEFHPLKNPQILHPMHQTLHYGSFIVQSSNVPSMTLSINQFDQLMMS